MKRDERQIIAELVAHPRRAGHFKPINSDVHPGVELHDTPPSRRVFLSTHVARQPLLIHDLLRKLN